MTDVQPTENRAKTRALALVGSMFLSVLTTLLLMAVGIGEGHPLVTLGTVFAVTSLAAAILTRRGFDE